MAQMRGNDWLLLVLLSVLWGGSFFFAAVALPAIPPLTLVLARVTLAAAALLPVLYCLGHRLPRAWAQWRSFAVLALLNNVVPFTLIVYGQTRITSGLAAVINATTPLFTLIIARVFAGEALGASRLAGVATGIIGVAILVGEGALTADIAGVVGMLCVLGGALSYGMSALWMRTLRHIPPILTAGAQLICAAVLLLPMAAIVDRCWQLPWPSSLQILAVLALALLSTAVAYILFFRISATSGPSNVMLVTLLIPLTATLLGVLVLGERLAPHQLLGGLIIASGLLVTDGRVLGWMKRWAHAT
jgi:drug/metabolite transporter (DMT)-like permease